MGRVTLATLNIMITDDMTLVFGGLMVQQRPVK